MRSLNKKVKIIFAVFSACVAVMVGGFIAAAVVVANAQSREYTLSSGTVTYDNVYTQITLEQQGTVSTSSDGGYQLTVGETVYSLGNSTVAALPGNTGVEVFGGQYVFDTDGTVTTMGDHYSFDDLTTTRLGKISDTKYVIIGDSIETEDGQLDVSGYLYIVLDSAGNARVINGGTNVKLLSGAVLKAGNLVWNLEDGTIDMGDYTIDLSTLANYSFTSGQTYSYTIQGGNGGSGGTGGDGGSGGTGGTGGDGGVGGDGGTGGTGGVGGVGGVGGTGGTGGVGGTGGTGSSSGSGGLDEELIKALTSFTIRGTEATSSSATIKLSMYDPFNYYAVGEIWLWETYTDASGAVVTDVETVTADGVEIRVISANQTDNSVYFSGLEPDTTYSVAFGYYDDTASFIQADYTSFTTEALDRWISVTSVALQYVTTTVKLDASADLPDDARIYLLELADSNTNTDSLDTLGITVSGGYNDSSGLEYTDISSYISQMTKSGGVSVTSGPTEYFISTTDTVGSEANAYVLVVAVGTFDGTVEEIGRQVVRNPYYGMSVYYVNSSLSEYYGLEVGVYSMSSSSASTTALVTALQETVSALTEEVSSLQSTVESLSSSSSSSDSSSDSSAEEEEEEQTEEEAAAEAIAAIQAMINALPSASTVTADNADEIGALLDDIDDARAAYYSTYKSNETLLAYLDALDYSKYDALCAALDSLSAASAASTASTANTSDDDDEDESETSSSTSATETAAATAATTASDDDDEDESESADESESEDESEDNSGEASIMTLEE